MSRVPVLLRNVIRHTDAHNKIQEESEMWKMRVMEKQPPFHRQMPATDMARGHMHCDRVEDGPRDRLRERLGNKEPSGQDHREARYWTRKLYEFEANDPDRWGHNGFKELYPEEFQSEEEKKRTDNENQRHKRKKSKTSIDAAKSKRSKKSSKKKKKKKEERRKRGEESDGEASSSDGAKGKKRKSGKSKHRRKRSERGREEEEEEESISEDSDEEGRRGKRTQSHRKRQRDSHPGSESGPESHRKRRKNWKAPNKEKSEESSED